MKKTLAWILAACLAVAGALPAFAAEVQPEEIIQEIGSAEGIAAEAAEAVEAVEPATEADAGTPTEEADAFKTSGEETAEALLSAGIADYLYFKNTGADTVTIKIESAGLGDGVDLYEVPVIKVSRDKNVWSDVTIGASKKRSTDIEVPKGGTVYFKGDFTPADEFSSSKYIRFTADGTDASLKLGGDITTLLDGVGGIDDLGSLAFPRYNGKYAFTNLFSGMEALTDISELKLPSAKLNSYCYYQMFTGSGIREVPEGLLPAVSLADSCYKEMFSECQSLERISAILPAAEVKDFCYEGMFEDCTALTEIPANLLPAADLSGAEEACYAGMFRGCTALKEIPAGLLPAAKLCEACYFQMFSKTGITEIPEDLLPAATLAEYCYQEMFAACEGLTDVPAKLLPAEELAESCYYAMFALCTSLKEAPDLPAENLVENCYASMFEGCEELESVRAAFEKWGGSDREDPDYCATDGFLPSSLADGVVLSFRYNRNLSEEDDNIKQLGEQIELLRGIHTVSVQMNEYGTLEPDHYLYHEDDDTVSLTPDPEEGMLITGVIYKDYRGEHDDAILYEGKYRFTMPADDVTVWATGEKKPDPKPDPTPSSGSSEPLFTGTWNNPVKNGKWTQDANGIWSYTTSEVFRNTWGYIVNPFAKEGQHQADWFLFDQYGHMLTGWQLKGGKWYYLNPTKDGTLGACLLGPGKTPDGWEIDETGAWTGK